MLRSRSDEVRVGHGQDMDEPLSVSERFMLDGDLYLDYDTPRASRWVWSKWRSWVRSWTRSDMAMAGMSLGLFACMSFYFYIPSSLYIYVTCLCFTAPALLDTTIMRRLRTRRTDQKKRLQVTGVITAFVLACLVRDLFFSASVPRHWRTPRTSTYYIASLLHNSEAILPHYSRSLLHLAKDLGPSNVYVSIYENDSHDRTPALLRTLDQQLQSLGVSTHIVTDTQSKDTRQKDRIERLATYRNLAMAPLNEALGGMLHGKPFDKVIWINDVFFESDTVHALLDTEGGEFDQACAMDFCWLGFYDTWVMRDADGKTMRPFWPYFRATQDQAAVRARLPVPVNACWNGITAFDARWFMNATTNASLPTLTAAMALPPHRPLLHQDALDRAATVPLSFRSSSTCFASESLLSSLDMHRISWPHRPRIYVNPDLVVAYDRPNYVLYGSMMRWSVVAPWRYIWQYWVEHRLMGFALHILRRVDPCTEVFQPYWVPRLPHLLSSP